MSYMKSGFIVLAAFVICTPSVVQAQGYKQQGTRGGALAGAIIGGLIGARNDEALAGAAIGGVVGGITGRAIGRSQDARYRGNGYGAGYYLPTTNYRGGHRGRGVKYAPVTRVYRTNPYHAGYRGGGYSRGASYRGGVSYRPGRGW